MRIDIILEQILSAKLYTDHNVLMRFFNTLDHQEQLAVISAIYIGRDHIHSEKLLRNISRTETDHIPSKDYNHILEEKLGSLKLYMETFLKCARACKYNFDDF